MILEIFSNLYDSMILQIGFRVYWILISRNCVSETVHLKHHCYFCSLLFLILYFLLSPSPTHLILPFLPSC